MPLAVSYACHRAGGIRLRSGYTLPTMPTDDPGLTYAHALADEQACLQRYQRRLTWLVRARIADLIAAVIFVGQACSEGGHFGLPAAISTGLFVVLTVAIALVERQSKLHEARVAYYDDGIARVSGTATKHAADGQKFADPAHPFAVDLDIFGKGSLFAHLCMARTASGQAQLADWLRRGSSVAEVAGRQRAVSQLAERLPLRRDLWLAGGTVLEDLRQEALQEALEAWLSSPVTVVPRWQRMITAILGAFGCVVLYAFANPKVIPLAVAIVLVQRLWAQRHRTLTTAVQARSFRHADELAAIAKVAERLLQERFTDPRLTELLATLADSQHDSQQRAPQVIAQLRRLVYWLESRRNQLFAIPAVVLLLPEQLVFAIEAWRARHGARALRWLTTIAEMEALASLATFAFEHPDYAFPSVVEGAEPCFVAQALAHPLLPPSTRIANDVRLDAACRLLVVTGSNMSGKSTLLRTVGVNTVLALAGAPVCAARLTLTPLSVGASLRAQDSLEAGVSRFFAEIKRLHAILSLAGQTPVLFLLDEILNGTNSQDRREGATAVIRSLLDRGAIGLVTTHDLALSELADGPHGLGKNVHFQDTLEGDRLRFDYRLRPGVVTRRNAIDLMRLVGIDVAPVSR